MLNYQSTSYHDAAGVRRLLGLRPAPEFLAWLTERGLFRDGRLAPIDQASREQSPGTCGGSAGLAGRGPGRTMNEIEPCRGGRAFRADRGRPRSHAGADLRWPGGIGLSHGNAVAASGRSCGRPRRGVGGGGPCRATWGPTWYAIVGCSRRPRERRARSNTCSVPTWGGNWTTHRASCPEALPGESRSASVHRRRPVGRGRGGAGSGAAPLAPRPRSRGGLDGGTAFFRASLPRRRSQRRRRPAVSHGGGAADRRTTGAGDGGESVGVHGLSPAVRRHGRPAEPDLEHPRPRRAGSMRRSSASLPWPGGCGRSGASGVSVKEELSGRGRELLPDAQG